MPRKARPTLFVAPGSTSCLESIRVLYNERVDYEQHDVSRDPRAASRLRRLLGTCEVPAIVWGNDVLSNFTDWQLTRFVRQHRE